MIWLKYTWFCGAFPKSRWAISYTAFIRTVVPHVKTCHKIISLDVISHVFPNKFLQIYITSVSRKPALHIQNLSNRCRHKYDSSISQIFKNLFLAGFCNLVQLCGGSSISTGLSHSLIPLGEALLAFLCLLVLLRFLPCALHELHSAHYGQNGSIWNQKLSYIFSF